MRRSRSTNTVRRRGIAPLELVLVLPLMMMVAGLMLFVANAGVWKLRAHSAAREAAFQVIQPREGEQPVPPPEWRRPDLTFSIQPGNPIGTADPLQNHPLFRGPAWPPLRVNPQLFDSSKGMVVGQATSAVASGLWPQMRVNYRFQRDVPVMAGHQWQYHAMGLPSHDSRRSTFLWQSGNLNP